MKFGLGSASGMAGAMQGFGAVENQKMQYQQEMNKILAQMKVDKDANTPTPNGVPNTPIPVAPSWVPPKLFANSPGGVDVNVGMSGFKTLEDRIREYLNSSNAAHPQTGANISYLQSGGETNGGSSLLPGHQDLGSGVTFHPPTNTYFYGNQPVMSHRDA